MSNGQLPHVAPIRAMRLTAMYHGGTDIVLYEFRPTDGSPVAPFTAGSLVNLRLPNGMLRQYSLANDPRESHRYLLGIKKDVDSRGGSHCVHEALRPGMRLDVGKPRKTFALDESAPHTVLIAGGIGITPMHSMVHRAEEIGLPWELHCAGCTRLDAVFADEVGSDARVHLHIDGEHAAAPWTCVPSHMSHRRWRMSIAASLHR